MDIIEISHLTKRFGAFTAVQDNSLTVARGEVFAFLGPNGAGKSTTIKMLVTLLAPTSGTLTVAGHDTRREPAAVRDALGIVFQDFSLDDELTALENLEFHGAIYGLAAAERRERAAAMLTLVDLADRGRSLVKTFSGGMKRRLELARALMHEPQVLFLDEPTLGLDPQTRNHIWDYIGRLNREHGLTVFFTTHYMDEAERYATRLAVIDHGEIVVRGTVDEIKATTGMENLEGAFLALTGYDLREEHASAVDRLRLQQRAWHK
jgi:ABC-2 type transport system ATP-binding protein